MYYAHSMWGQSPCIVCEMHYAAKQANLEQSRFYDYNIFKCIFPRGFARLHRQDGLLRNDIVGFFFL